VTLTLTLSLTLSLTPTLIHPILGLDHKPQLWYGKQSQLWTNVLDHTTPHHQGQHLTLTLTLTLALTLPLALALALGLRRAQLR